MLWMRLEKNEVYFENERLIVKEKGGRYVVDLQERLLNFAVDILKFLMKLPNRKEFDVIRYQLSKAGTSIKFPALLRRGQHREASSKRCRGGRSH